MNDKEFCDKCHFLIHSLRLLSGYKPSNAEIKLSEWVIEKYSNECEECKQRGIELLNNPKPKGFMDKIKGALNEN